MPLRPASRPGATGIYTGPSVIIIVRKISLIKTPQLHTGLSD